MQFLLASASSVRMLISAWLALSSVLSNRLYSGVLLMIWVEYCRISLSERPMATAPLAGRKGQRRQSH